MYNQVVGYDDAIDISTTEGMLEALSWIGLSSLIRNTSIFKDERAISILYSNNLIKRYYDLLSDPSILTLICSKAAKNNINLCQNPNWSSFLDEKFNLGISNSHIVYEAYRSQDHYINFYLGWKGDVDWMQIYNLYFSKQKSNGYITAPFVRSMESYFKQNPLCARASIENDLFDATSKPDANVRSEMYIQYIKAGYLDKKKARKIRSESSEYASSKALIALLDLHDENPSIYPNIDDLLLQFTDTKYSSVQETLAARAPFRILYAFVGFDSRYAKSMLEQRMQNGK